MQRFFLPSTLTLSLLLASCTAPTADIPAEPTLTGATHGGPSTAEQSSAEQSSAEQLASAPSASAETANATDSVPQVSRVVALTSLSASLVQSLAPERLVGVPGSSLIRNDARFQDITPVTEERVPPNLETIVSLKPDLVIGAVGFHDQALQRLQDLKVPTLAVEIKDWEALENLTQDLANRLGADAQPLQSRYQACIGNPAETAKSVLVLSGQAPILSPNKASWAGSMLAALGATNVAAELQGESPFEGYITLSPEKILAADPDNIILIDTPDGAMEALKTQAFWKQLTAVQQNQVYSLDYYGLVNPGSIESIEMTCQRLQELLSPAV